MGPCCGLRDVKRCKTAGSGFGLGFKGFRVLGFRVLGFKGFRV